MKESIKITSKKPRLALVAMIAVFGAASPALAQSYSFPTYAYTHSGAGSGSAGHAPTQRGHLYDAAAKTPPAADTNAWGSAAARGNSH